MTEDFPKPMVRGNLAPFLICIQAVICALCVEMMNQINSSSIFPTGVAIFGVFIFGWMIVSWMFMTKNVFDPYFIFILLAFFFYWGQPTLILLGFDMSQFKVVSVENFPQDVLAKSMAFTLTSMSMFHLGGLSAVIFARNRKAMPSRYGTTRPDDEKRVSKAMIKAGVLLLLVSIIPVLKMMGDYLASFRSSGYDGIFTSDFATSTGLDGGYYRVLEGYFEPAIILLILGSGHSKRTRYFALTLAFTYVGFFYLIGSRGSATLFLLSIAFAWNYGVKRFTKKARRLFGAAMLLITMFLSFLSSIRGSQKSLAGVLHALGTFHLDFSYLYSALAEMGITLYANTIPIVLTPSVIQFGYGRSYLNNLLALIPNFFWVVNPAAHTLEQLYSDAYLHTSIGGVGGSFIMEAYYNFGYYAILIMPIFGYLVCLLYLKLFQGYLTNNKLLVLALSQITGVIIWYVRTETLSFSRDAVYYSVFPILLCLLLNRRTRNPQQGNFTVDRNV